jgi:hypothetical protein
VCGYGDLSYHDSDVLIATESKENE